MQQKARRRSTAEIENSFNTLNQTMPPSSPKPHTVRKALSKIPSHLRSLWPPPTVINAKEKWRASLGAALGILVVATVSALWLYGAPAAEYSALTLAIVAPIEASAVLVFAVPSSPLAQPWSVVAGNTLSAVIGIACVKWVPDATLAAAFAVSLAIAAMLAARYCIPPVGRQPC